MKISGFLGRSKLRFRRHMRRHGYWYNLFWAIICVISVARFNAEKQKYSRQREVYLQFSEKLIREYSSRGRMLRKGGEWVQMKAERDETLKTLDPNKKATLLIDYDTKLMQDYLSLGEEYTNTTSRLASNSKVFYTELEAAVKKYPTVSNEVVKSGQIEFIPRIDTNGVPFFIMQPKNPEAQLPDWNLFGPK